MKSDYICFKDDGLIYYVNLGIIKRIEINYKTKEIFLDDLVIRNLLFEKSASFLTDYLNSKGIDTSDTNMQNSLGGIMNEKFIEDDIVMYQNKKSKIIKVSGCPIGSSMNFYDIVILEDNEEITRISNVPKSDLRHIRWDERIISCFR